MAPKERDSGYWIKTAICLFLLFGFGRLIPPFGGLSPLGMRVLGTFLGMLFGWTTLGFVWPSIMSIISLGLSGYASTAAVISMGMGSVNITILVFFLLIFANYVNDIGLSTVVANWFISRKFTVGRPWLFTTMMLLCIFLLSATVSLYASIFLMWNIFYSICKTVGYKPYEKYPMIVLTGLAFSAALGYAVFPFRAVPVMSLGAFSTASNGLTVSFGEFTIVNGVLAISTLFAYILVCRFVFKPDMTPLLKAGDIFAGLRHQTLNAEQKVGLGFTLLFFFGMFAPSVFPETTFIGSFFRSLGTTGTLLLILGLLSIVKLKGTHIFHLPTAAKGVKWELILMFMATVPVSEALSAPEVGIIDFMVDAISPVFLGMSPAVFAVAFIASMAILTQFTQNVVLAAVIPPVLYNFCVIMGVDPRLMITLFTFAVSSDLATPSASATSAMVFANTEWIDMKSAYKYCITAAAMSVLVTLIIGFPLSKIVF